MYLAMVVPNAVPFGMCSDSADKGYGLHMIRWSHQQM